jgi:hypothetical protein
MTKYILHPPPARCSPIEEAVQDAESLLGIHVTVHDLSGTFADSRGEGLLGRWRGSHRRYQVCADGYCRRCLRHCGQAVNKRAAASEGAFTHRCWKGIVEQVVPLRIDGVHVGTLFAGHWRTHRPRTPRGLRCEAAALIRRLSPLPAAGLMALGRTLETFAAGLLVQAAELRGRSRPALSRREQVLRFVEVHAAERVRLSDLANALHLSPSRTSHLVRELTGRSYQQLVLA